jgi:hypothetical protein
LTVLRVGVILTVKASGFLKNVLNLLWVNFPEILGLQVIPKCDLAFELGGAILDSVVKTGQVGGHGGIEAIFGNDVEGGLYFG